MGEIVTSFVLFLAVNASSINRKVVFIQRVCFFCFH